MYLLAVEGHDYAGKTSIATTMVKKFNELGIKAEYLKIPEYGSQSGRVIASYLRGEQVISSELAASCVYALNRIKPIKDICEREDKPEVLVVDRCYLSNVCTQFNKNMVIDAQGYRQSFKEFMSAIDTIEHVEAGVPAMDNVVFLYCDDDAIRERKANRLGDSLMADGKEDILESDERVKSSRMNYQYASFLLNRPCIDTSNLGIDTIATMIVGEFINDKGKFKESDLKDFLLYPEILKEIDE